MFDQRTVSNRSAVLGRVLVLCSALAMFAAASNASSQSAGWRPDKHVEIIVGGGAQDRLARVIQKIWQDSGAIGVPVTVVNKLGGGGAIGWAYLNQYAGDGRYIALSTSPLLTNAITGKNLLTHTDVTPLAQLFTEYTGFLVRMDSAIKSGADLLERLKRDPASLSIAVAPGLGGANHIALASALKAAGGDIKKLRTVVFPGSPESITALLGGHVDVVTVSAGNAVPHMQAGTLRVLAISSSQRVSDALASIPTWKELGINSVVGNWRGMVGPKGLSATQVAYWDDIFVKLTQSADWKTAVKQNMWDEEYRNSADSRKFLEARHNEYKALLTELGLAK